MPTVAEKLTTNGELISGIEKNMSMVPYRDFCSDNALDSQTATSSDCFTVGWIAAVPLERAAAEQMLDAIYPTPTDFIKATHDHNTYTFGRIGRHYIAITSLEIGTCGTNSAANTAQWMLSSLPQIQFGLLVGTGWGIPTEDADIRLGDVAVSMPAGCSGGVVQYDLVKATSSGFQRKGSLNKPPAVLLSALGKLQCNHICRDYEIPKIVHAWKKRNPAMFRSTLDSPGFGYQGVENDRLFREEYRHVEGRNCRNCDASKIVARDPPARIDPERPRIHYGVIASGNVLVKDAAWRQKLIEHVGEECICYDMEAAGVMNNFPCLVIRGICGYADSHDSDLWQPYAAGTAAAFAKELLSLVDARGLASTPRPAEFMKNG